MKKAGWIAYGILVIALQTGGLVAAVSEGTPVFFLGFGALMMAIYLTGLYGYVYEIAIRTRRTWEIVPWIMVAGLVLDTFRSIRTDGFLMAVGPLIFVLPLLYALLRYGYFSNHIWGTGGESASAGDTNA